MKTLNALFCLVLTFYAVLNSSPAAANTDIARRCQSLFLPGVHTYHEGRLISADLADAKRGDTVRLYSKDLVLGEVEILRTSNDFSDSPSKVIADLYRIETFGVPIVVILKDGSYKTGTITGGDFFTASVRDAELGSRTLILEGQNENPIRLDQISAFGNAKRNVTQIEELIQNLPRMPEKPVDKTYVGLSIAEQGAYRELLALTKGDRIDIFPKDAIYTGEVPREAVFFRLNERAGHDGKRNISALFEIVHLIGSSRHELVEIPLREFVDKTHILLPFNLNPQTRTNQHEQRLSKWITENKNYSGQIGRIYFDPAYRPEFRPSAPTLTVELASLKVFPKNGYFWLSYKTSNGVEQAALLRSVRSLKIEMPINH